jgi:DNA-binding transcriptional LysR family regulator
VEPTDDGRKRQLTGYEYFHVAVDDHPRLAYGELPDLNARCAIAFLRRAIVWFARKRVWERAGVTDDGSAHVSDEHAQAVRGLAPRRVTSWRNISAL